MSQGASTLAFLVMPVESTIHATVNWVSHLFESTTLWANKTHVSDFIACRPPGQSAELPAATSDAVGDKIAATLTTRMLPDFLYPPSGTLGRPGEDSSQT
jgi:hypothetical protein